MHDEIESSSRDGLACSSKRAVPRAAITPTISRCFLLAGSRGKLACVGRTNYRHEQPRHREPPRGGWPGLLAFLWRLLVSSEPRSTSFYADRQRHLRVGFWFLAGVAVGIAMTLQAHSSSWC